MKKYLWLILLIIPLLAIAQTDAGEQTAAATVKQNGLLIDQLAQLSPMAINPYTSVFLTSVFSKAGFHNDYVSTNPFYDNWFIVILFGVLFFFTAIVGGVISTNKVTAPIKTADNYLQNFAGPVINAVIILTPMFFTEIPEGDQVVFQAGFISVSLRTGLILILSTYMLFVIMTMRLFIDFLIFLSPVPFIDAGLEVVKNVISVGLVLISIVSPMTSVIITGLMFLISLLFLRQAKKLTTKVEYLLVYPILNTLRNKEKVLMNGENFSVLAYTKTDFKSIKKSKIVRLEKRDDQFFIKRNRLFLPSREEEITLENPTLSQTHLDILLTCSPEVRLILNRSYHRYIDEISENLNAQVISRTGIKFNLGKGLFYRLKNMFNKRDIETIKTT